jgi:Delta3,5-Delta2,4-dienoyl-CoA isomerase
LFLERDSLFIITLDVREDKMASTLQITKQGAVAHVELARPKQGNAMNAAFWKEYREAFKGLGEDMSVRCIVVSAQGKFFTAGLDIKDQSILATGSDSSDPARIAFANRRKILEMQETFTVMERCPQPVIMCVHNACIGGGIDMISAADIRFCTKDAFFSIKEVDIGLAADVGTLQRIQLVTGNASLVRELAYTAR